MPKIIAFANEKGGQGKSTILETVGAILSHYATSDSTKLRILCIDLDSQRGGLTHDVLGGVDLAYGSYDVLTMENEDERDLFKGGIISTAHGFDLLGSDKRMLHIEADLNNDAFKAIRLDEAIRCSPTANSYDFILIDTPGNTGVCTVNAFLCSHQVVFISLLEDSSIAGVQTGLRLCKTLQRKSKSKSKTNISGVLFNRVKANSVAERTGYECLEIAKKENPSDWDGVYIYRTRIRDREDVKKAKNVGQSLLSYNGKSDVLSDVSDFIAEMLNKEA